MRYAYPPYETMSLNGESRIPLPWIKSILLIAGLLALATAWRWTPLGDWLDAQTLAAWAADLQEGPLGLVVTLGVFVIGSLVVFPVTLLIAACALVFGPLLGFVYALLGALLGAAASYAAGYAMGSHMVRRFGESLVNRLSRALAQRGVLAITVLRLVPIAPFTLINLAAGASHIRFRDYMLGTLLGMGPGILALTLFADTVYETLENPQPSNFVWLAIVVIAIGLGAWGVRYWLKRRARIERPIAEDQA